MTLPTHTSFSLPSLSLFCLLASSAACAKSRTAVPADDSADAGDTGLSAAEALGPATAEVACPVSNPYCRENQPTTEPPSCASVEVLTDAELTAALPQISNSLASCAFALGGLPDDADKEAINLYLNGALVPFDTAATEHDGWGWLDPEQTSIQLFGDSCEDFKNNRRTSVIVEFACAPVIAI